MFVKLLVIGVTLVVSIRRVGSKMQGFVVGGQEASIEMYPHSAYLFMDCNSQHEESPYWICGSSIINQYFTLTAAHCLIGCTKRGRILVIVGSNCLENGTELLGYKFKTHDEYREGLTQADIALLRLKPAVPLRAGINRIILLKNPPVSKTAFVAGWGLTDVSLQNSG